MRVSVVPPPVIPASSRQRSLELPRSESIAMRCSFFSALPNLWRCPAALHLPSRFHFWASERDILQDCLTGLLVCKSAIAIMAVWFRLYLGCRAACRIHSTTLCTGPTNWSSPFFLASFLLGRSSARSRGCILQASLTLTLKSCYLSPSVCCFFFIVQFLISSLIFQTIFFR